MQKLTYGVLTSGYESTRFKKESKAPALASVEILSPGISDADMTKATLRGVSLARGNLFCRYLVEAPPNVCTPQYMADAAKSIATQFPDVMQCKIFEQADCEAMGMGCYLGVSEVRRCMC